MGGPQGEGGGPIYTCMHAVENYRCYIPGPKEYLLIPGVGGGEFIALEFEEKL